MKEIGIVKKITGKTARVAIERHAACGECGACQVSKDKMSMTTTARNDAGAQVGDQVSVEMEFGNVMKATSIAYGIPLIAFLLGCGLGFWLGPILGWDQVITSFCTGVLLTAVSYGIIHLYDRRGAFGKGYEPIITAVLSQEDLSKLDVKPNCGQ